MADLPDADDRSAAEQERRPGPADAEEAGSGAGVVERLHRHGRPAVDDAGLHTDRDGTDGATTTG